ncbi:MAG TPA: (Fe-S)-binding protein [Vicinamibacterales bacterium]|nr:(Fe-S)-binding protein [Vicinamibacterales bacterium]
MPRPSRVQFFATCLVDVFSPSVGLAAVAVLERLGVGVDVVPDQTCCGQPAFNGGFVEEAAAMARHTIDVLSRSPDPVVVPSGSCADMIAGRYPEIFDGDAVYGPKARALAERTYEFCQFLADVLGAGLPAAASGPALAYHASCHGLRGLGLRAQPRAVLRAVAGGRCRDLPDAEVCCGFGGVFAVKMGPLSGAMLESKLDAVEASGADFVVATDLSCLMHIGGGLRRRGSRAAARHIAEVVADAFAEDRRE